MCGRYSLFASQTDLESRFGASFGDDFEPRYNAAPGQTLPVITDEEPDEIRRLKWGLVPRWADDATESYINARSETVREKPAFAEAYGERRCLVPADGFYEWADTGDGKRPHRVAFEDDRPFAMAGLYERWEPPKPETTQTGLGAFGGGGDAEPESDDGPVETFTVVTTEPNEVVADLHHRMAVILDPDEEETWLRGDPDAAADLLDPYPATDLTAHPVSTRVNSPAVDAPELIEPVG